MVGVRSFFGGGAPLAGVELFAGPFGEGRRVAHRLICMVSLVILKCINLVVNPVS